MCRVGMVSRMKSKRLSADCMACWSVDSSTWCAPRARASSALLGEVVITVTSAPSAAASFTPMWPRPPRPTTATFEPWPTPKRRIGFHTVMPAHSSGEAKRRSRLAGTRRTNFSRTTMESE
ncbi:hypothetical protein D3C78_1380770 [compost metagenome]